MDKVVKLTREKNIAIVSLEEREYGNTFTDRFIKGIQDTFAVLQQDPEIKVVIVHGYDNYFCCGGTQKELMGIFELVSKKEKVSTAESPHLSFNDLFLNCEVPVIAAMQGHALGGGLALGCTADIIVMGEECIYSANFMKYGFTPGFGATYIIPKKFGESLGTEMLYSARNYYGQELKVRGAPIKIIPKQEVIRTALEIAKQLTDKPLLSLKVLKKHLTGQIHKELSEAVKKEMEMHRATFAQPEVRSKIELLFGN